MLNRRKMVQGGVAAGIYGAGTGSVMASTPDERPAKVPAEEAPHHATFMMWPNSRRVYDDALFLEDVQQTIMDVANTIADFEPVILLADA
ncbi:MAG: agmatine deiminase family protein, partial [Pseudomonadota bacterium]